MMDIERAIAAANHAMVRHFGRHLSDVETEILKGSWQGQTYDQIASISGYSDSYLRRDVGTKFWKALSQSLGETVSKNNFKEALRRHADQALVPDLTPKTIADVTSRKPSDQPGSNVVIKNPYEFYIERAPLETICCDTLCQPGALVRVKAPSLMGKTLLMDQVLTQLEAQGLRTVRISLELADRQVHFSNLNRFLRWLCINITRALALPNELDDYWDEEGMGSKVSCSTYVEEYLLAYDDTPLVLCLDDVDLLFSYPDIYEDFFGLLRSWYEMARTRSRPLWKRLRLAIVHSTEVYIPLNINQSPFNVGVPIELTEFTPAQTQQFAQLHGLTASLELTPLMAMVGGHPYLLEQAFDYLKAHSEASLGTLLAAAPTEAGIYANHLREHWITLRDMPALTNTLRQVVQTSKPMVLESVQAHQLHSMGVIKLTGNIAEPRCQLYRQYFATQLGER